MAGNDLHSKKIVERIGLSEYFLKNLLKSDDWSFIIKLHALFESVCSSLLTYHFKDENLKEVFSNLELSNKKTGKIAFLKATKLVDSKKNRKFISELSQLRNILVHNIDNYDFNLDEHLKKLNNAQLKIFLESFGPIDFSLIPKQEHEQKMNDLKLKLFQNPKWYIYTGAVCFFESINGIYDFNSFYRFIRENDIDISF